MEPIEIKGSSHIALAFKDISEPYRFFTDVLCFREKLDFTYEGERVVILGAKGSRIELVEKPDGAGTFGSLHHIAFRVGNIQRAMKQARENGCSVLKDVYCPVEGVSEAMIEGPCGLRIQLVQLNHLKLILRAFKRGHGHSVKEMKRRKGNTC